MSFMWKLSVNFHMGQLTSICHMSHPHAVPVPHWTIWQMVLLATMGAKEKMWPDQYKCILMAVGACLEVRKALSNSTGQSISILLPFLPY